MQNRKDNAKKQQYNQVSQRQFANSLVKRGTSYASAVVFQTAAPKQNYSRAVGAEKITDLESLKSFFTQSLLDLNASIQNRMNQLTTSINEISGRTDFIFDTFCQNE